MINVTENFITFCDDMIIAEESSNENNAVASINDAIRIGVNNKHYKIKKDNILVSFHDNVLNKINHNEIVNLYNKIISKKALIIKLIANGAYAELKDDMTEERRDEIISKSYIDYIDFYLDDNDKLDASVTAYDAEQFYMKDVNSKGFSIKNVDYLD